LLIYYGENITDRIVHSCNAFFFFVSSARLNKMDIDTNSFTSQELKKALAKMKESEKAERMVRTVPCF